MIKPIPLTKATSKHALAPRARIEIRYDAALASWIAVHGTLLIGLAQRKAELVARQAAMRTFDFAQFGQRSELFIKGKDGRIQDKRTYGDDPRSIKG